MAPNVTPGETVDQDALDASIDQAVDALFVDSLAAPPGRPHSGPGGGAEPDGELAEELRALKQVVLALDWEISPGTIDSLQSAVVAVKGNAAVDPTAHSILGRMEELCEHLHIAGPGVSPETIQFLHFATRELHTLLQHDTPAEARASTAAELESRFQHLGLGCPGTGEEEDAPTNDAQGAEHAPETSPDPSPMDTASGADAGCPLDPTSQPLPSPAGSTADAEDEEIPLLEPEEVLDASPPSLPEVEAGTATEVESLPFLAPEPDSTEPPSAEQPSAGPDVNPDPGVAGVSLEPDLQQPEPAPCQCQEAAHDESPQLLAALDANARLARAIDQVGEEVHSFFTRILRAAESKPQLERLAASLSRAREAVSNRLVATEEIAAELRVHLEQAVRPTDTALPRSGAPGAGCPLGGEAQEIAGAASQIQEAVAMLQETLAMVVTQQSSRQPAGLPSPHPEGGPWSPLEGDGGKETP